MGWLLLVQTAPLSVPHRPRLSEGSTPPRPPPPPPGGGQRSNKKVCVPEIGLKFPAPLINFIFCLRKSFLMRVGGWVRLTGQGPNPPPPPPPGLISRGLVPQCMMCLSPATPMRPESPVPLLVLCAHPKSMGTATLHPKHWA